MEIDNFDIIREHLDFIDTKLDRYVVHILRRPKDISPEMKNALGANESQRLIKTYYIDSLEYFDRKREAIKELCRANNARAYINVQPKDNFECLLNLGKKILETICNKNYSVKPEHLIRQAYCEWHKTRKKQWVIDLDEDDPESMQGWTLDQVVDLVQHELEAVGKTKDDMYIVKTKHGHHIVTSPVNLSKAYEKCKMMFEGVHKGVKFADVKEVLEKFGYVSPFTGEDIFPILAKERDAHTTTSFNVVDRLTDFFGGSDYENWTYEESCMYEQLMHKKQADITGWLHKDGMTILFCN